MQIQRKKLCIIGAGLSGLSAGFNLLKQTNNFDITFIEKSFKVSGRATTRKIKDYIFDSGATTLTYTHLNNPLMIKTLLDDLVKDKIKIEKDIFTFNKDFQIIESDRKNQDLFGFESGIISMGTQLQNQCQSMGAKFLMQQNVIGLEQQTDNKWLVSYKNDQTHESQKNEEIVTKDIFDMVLLTIPSPQALILIENSSFLQQNHVFKENQLNNLKEIQYNSQLSVLIGLKKKVEKPYYGLLNLDKLSDIAWVSFESDKKGHCPQERSSLIVQMSDSYSKKNYNFSDKNEILSYIVSLLNKLDIQIDISDIELFDIKKWKFALPKNNFNIDFSQPNINLFLAGDYTKQSGKALLAIESGLEVSQQIIQNNFKNKL